MDGYFVNLAAFNTALALEAYNTYSITLDGAEVKVGESASPPMRYVTNENDASILLRPANHLEDNIWHVFAAGTPVYTGNAAGPAVKTAGPGTVVLKGVSVVDSSINETWTMTFSSATAFAVSGSTSGSKGTGTTGTAFTGGNLHFTVAPDALFDNTTIFTVAAGVGAVGSISVDATTGIGETYSIQFTSATAFRVIGSVVGEYAHGTVGTAYVGSPLHFTVASGTAAFGQRDTYTIQVK